MKAVVISGFAVLLGTVAWAASVLDQQQEKLGAGTRSGALYFCRGESCAQTFTAGLSGKLTRVDVSIWWKGYGPSGYPAVIEIQTTASGMPTGKALGSVRIDDGFTSGWNSIDFSSEHVFVTAGTMYAIVVQSDEDDPSSAVCVYWNIGYQEDIYPAGQIVRNADERWKTQTNPSGDALFRTYVDPSLNALSSYSITIEPADARTAGAQWRIDEGPWHASGEVCQDIAPEYHTVEFKQLPFWVRPDSRRVLVARGHDNKLDGHYELIKSFVIGDIPPQTVWQGQTLEMFVCAPADRPNDKISAIVDPSKGYWDEPNSVFTYTPTEDDKNPFQITFVTQGSPSRQQVVEVTPMPALPEEQSALKRDPLPDPPDPDSKSYCSVREQIVQTAGLNYQPSTSVRNVTIVGKQVVFEQGHVNGLWDMYSNRQGEPKLDVKQMTIYAETVIVRSALHLPQTDVTIYARDLRFEDVDPAQGACIITTPISGGDREHVTPARAGAPGVPGGDGTHGLKAGDVTLYIESFDGGSGTVPRLITRGGDGQDAGEGMDGGTPGRDIPTWVSTHGWGGWKPNPFGGDQDCITYWEMTGKRGDMGIEHRETWGTLDWPGDGDDATAGGTPGDGGAGGNVTATLFLLLDADTSGGHAGVKTRDYTGARAGKPELARHYSNIYNDPVWVKTDEHHSQKGKDEPAKDPRIPIGDAGVFQQIEDPFSWLNPYALRMSLRWARDAYLIGRVAEARDSLQEYHDRLTAYAAKPEWWCKLSEQWQLELDQIDDEISGLLDQIQNNLDYFGHPAGWVPFLSFEVRQAAYEGEIEQAMGVLYLSYWLQHYATSVQDRLEALKNAVEKAWDDVQQSNEGLDALQHLISQIASDLADITEREQACMQELQGIEQRLTQEAQSRVEEQHKIPEWKKIAKVAATVCQVIPVGQPYLMGVGAGLTFISQPDSSDPWDDIVNRTTQVSDYCEGYSKAAATYSKEAKGIDLKVLEAKGPLEYIKNLRSYSRPLFEAAAQIRNTMKETQIPASAVDAELARIKASCPEFNAAVDRVAQLLAEKEVLGENMAAAMQQATELSTAITQDCLAITEMNRGISQNYSALDPSTVMYVQEMERRSRDRLLKYHYYMATAYEYRMLEPYTSGDLLIQNVFDRIVGMFEKIAKGEPVDPDRNQPDSDDAALGPNDYQALEALYKEQLSAITESILDAYEQEQEGTNVRPWRTSISYPLPADKIKKLNDDGEVTINLEKMGWFTSGERAVRIVDINVPSIHVETADPVPGVAAMDLYIEHQGISKVLTPDGQVLQFRHRATDSSNTPLRWGVKYNCIMKKLALIEAPPWADMLLPAVLPTLRDDAPLYLFPGGWGDLRLTKRVSPDGINVTITDLQLGVKYDFVPEWSLVKLTVAMADPNLCPYIELDIPDQNGRQDGRGNFTRVYRENKTVMVTAPASYGQYVFDHWANRSGKLLGTEVSLSVKVGQDTTIIAYFTSIGR